MPLLLLALMLEALQLVTQCCIAKRCIQPGRPDILCYRCCCCCCCRPAVVSMSALPGLAAPGRAVHQQGLPHLLQAQESSKGAGRGTRNTSTVHRLVEIGRQQALSAWVCCIVMQQRVPSATLTRLTDSSLTSLADACFFLFLYIT
jgi:hypothetical protein